jgi:hypothetical protein
MVDYRRQRRAEVDVDTVETKDMRRWQRCFVRLFLLVLCEVEAFKFGGTSAFIVIMTST